MKVDIKAVSTSTTIFPEISSFISLIDCPLHLHSLFIKLTPNINITSRSIHRPSHNNTPLDQLMRILPHNLSVLTRPRLTLISINHKIPWPRIFLPARFIHEREFQARGESSTSSTTKSRSLDFGNKP